jgi:2-polyprenyl-3-methyl-5-hydroxy-6-metoxy-1,4-benzoquinol methylase
MEALLQRLARDRDRWERIASSEPYYAVITQPQYLGAPTPAVRRAFFDSGDAYVDSLLTRVTTVGGGSTPPTVLEFGCGPGRLAYAFARRGFAVTAVDISPTMLALARRNAEERNIASIQFQLVEEFLAGDATYGLVNATLVLQQIEPDAGKEILRHLASRVAPGGTLHFQLPFRTVRSLASRAMIAARRSIPGVNALMNVVRRRPAEVAVLVPHVYPIDDVLVIIRESGLDVRNVELTKENELEVATVVARRNFAESPSPAVRDAAPAPVAAHAAPDVDLIDVREMIRSTPVADLNRRAEQYFATTTSFDSQLAKPFSSVADAPPMLVNVGVLLRGMRLVQGHVILDFGSGTGWLSGRLAEMGFRMILADVSETALRVARAHFESLGLLTSPDAHRFVHYDGVKLDLPNDSVDRIICFDSFHHVPNPDAVIHEFGRVLKPGGIAAFSEPGPNHSRSAQSQYEMRNYGVIENDVDMEEIWRDAKSAGFADLQLAVFTADPAHIPLEAFNDLLRGGEALTASAHSIRQFLENARVFFLRKAGEELLDSRTVEGLACEVEVSPDGPVRTASPIAVLATVTNSGKAVWLPSPVTPGGVWLGAHLYSRDVLLRLDYHWEALATESAITPGQTVTLRFALPPLEPGEYEVEFDCVSTGITWFAQTGSRPARLRIAVPAS